MKKIYATILAALLSTVLFAQPQKMSYQAVIRNSSNVLVATNTVGMRISILEGSSTGTAVYVETQTPTTNANGLVSIEIGSGTVVTGTFATIDWSTGTYYIKTETDPLGGTNYPAIVGTSQLLSVPYALYAKTGDNVTGIVAVANGGTGAISVSGAKTSLGLGNVDNTTDLLKPISTATQTALDLKAPLASPTFTGTPLATTATPGTNTTQIATTAFVASAIPAHYIGESYGGGIVFYVYDNGKHGLIAATADQSTGVKWNNGTYRYTGTWGDGLNAGAMNTAMIIATQIADSPTGNFAARVCADYSVTVGGVTYGDWYLPSKFELNLLYIQQSVVGGFPYENYWSSTEEYHNSAWTQYFGDGTQNSYLKDILYSVRAVRAF